ncbi:MAG: tRNA (adenosine(37)-N6)-threonylcarbamoyltransferase complex ATPase subunit type 1 TsaE [bacterium]
MNTTHDIKRIRKITSSSSKETMDIGKALASELKSGDIIYLDGELGSGKTVFVKGVCMGLGVEEEVTSSSFVIATEYEGHVPVVHIDLYRLDKQALDMLLIDEYFIEDGITVIEWADRLDAKSIAGIYVKIVIDEQKKRELTIENLRD